MRGPTRIPAVLILGLFALVGRASDPPHWSYANKTIDCNSCHALHAAPGGNLTDQATNVNLCQSCHNASGTASGMPVDSADAASLTNERGIHHAFGVPYNHAALNTAMPLNTAMANRVAGFGNSVVCSVCHDQHTGANRSGEESLPIPVKTVDAGGTGYVTVSTLTTSAMQRSYLIEITTGGTVGTARFRYSNDNGMSWVASNVLTAASVWLNDGFNLGISFTAGTYAVSERYSFYVSWPFLRAVLDSGDNTAGPKYCRDCHRN